MELTKEVKDFIQWLGDPVKCPFNYSYNGIDKTRDRVEFEKGNKHYTLDQVWEFYILLNLEK